jgi:group I intron endonuclease
MVIYQITNNITNDFYIGKSVNPKERFYKHKYNASQTNSQTHLYRAMRKYGTDNFSMSILDEANSKEELNDKEKMWINKLNPKYNMTKGGDGGDTSHSPNYIESMKKIDNSGSRNPMYGKKRNISKQQLDNAHREAQKANRCPVSCEGITYPSVGDAQSAYIGINVRKRLDNPKYPNFYRLRPKTKRK